MKKKKKALPAVFREQNKSCTFTSIGKISWIPMIDNLLWDIFTPLEIYF